MQGLTHALNEAQLSQARIKDWVFTCKHHILIVLTSSLHTGVKWFCIRNDHLTLLMANSFPCASPNHRCPMLRQHESRSFLHQGSHQITRLQQTSRSELE